MPSKIIELNHVTVHYENFVALRDVTFSVDQGEHVAVLGPNGAGKSTLIKTLLGLLTPHHGSVSVLGKNPVDLSFEERAQIGYVPQHQKMDSRFPVTVQDVVMMGRYAGLGLFRRPGRTDIEATENAMGLMGIEHLSKRPIGKLSGGEKQRALIARALCNELQLLILDEPTTSLDVQSTESLYTLLNDLREKMGLTVIVVSHDVGVVTKMADKIACLAGYLVAHGRPSEALTEATIECMYGKDTAVFGHSHVPHVMVSEHKKNNGEKK